MQYGVANHCVATVVLLKSLAAQLCANLPGFAQQLSQQSAQALEALRDAKPKVSAIFDKLLGEPLKAMAAPAKPFVVILDALDELPHDALQPMLTLIAEQFSQLPAFVRLFVTSREEERIKQALKRFKPHELRVDEARNKQDLRAYLASVARRFVKTEMSIGDIEAAVKAKWKDIDIAGKLGVLEEPLRMSKLTYDQVVEEIASEPGFKELCAIEEVRPSPVPQQNLGNERQGEPFDLLYEDAAEVRSCLPFFLCFVVASGVVWFNTAIFVYSYVQARQFLRDFISSEWQEDSIIQDKNGNVIARLSVPVEGKAKPWVDEAIEPGLKGKARALEKANNDYGGDVRQLRDLARQTLKNKRCLSMVQAIEAMREAGITFIGLKNKYRNPTPMGYRDINLNVGIPLKDGRVHIGEVQVNLQSMLQAKDKAHEYYEKVRSALPIICKDCGVKADDLEAFIMKLLQSSVPFLSSFPLASFITSLLLLLTPHSYRSFVSPSFSSIFTYLKFSTFSILISLFLCVFSLLLTITKRFAKCC